MNKKKYFEKYVSIIPQSDNGEFLPLLETKCEIITINKGDPLIKFNSSNRKMYCIIEGSFIRNIITSKGEEKTVMFHTENFCEFFKAYDTVYFHHATTYEIKANEKSVLVAVDFDFLFGYIQNELKLLQFYARKTEQMLITIDLFRNFQLALTSEEYLKWLYQHYGFLFQRFSGQNIASFMGITNVWLSNLKAKLIF
jgi:hypothetical protein